MTRQLAKLDRVWLAALIDGEGSIVVSRYKFSASKVRRQPSLKNARAYEARVYIYNTDHRLMEEVVRRTGVDRVYQSKPAQAGWRSGYQWRLFKDDIRWFLPLVLPFLVIKRDQARLVLELLKLADKRKPAKGQLPYSHPSMVSIRDRMEEICVEVGRLNGTTNGKRDNKHRAVPTTVKWKDRRKSPR